MKHLSIDIETRSDVDIGKSGAYRYAQSPEFEILLVSFKVDDAPVVLVDTACGEEIPAGIVSALRDPNIIKHAYNAAFEWYCLNQAGYETPIEQWQCTMVHGLYCGYPAGLDAVGRAIGLPEDKKKLSTGKALIRYFCCPQKATKRNGGRKYNEPADDPDRWRLFREYNKQDVETEYSVLERLKAFPLPETEEKAWQEDIRMNAYGIRVDAGLIEGAITLSEMSTDELKGRAKEITGLTNPNSGAQLLGWIKERGVDAPNLQKATVADLLAGVLPDDVREMLELRQKLGKTSVKKYEAMRNAMGEGDRVRGLLQFYGANRTGRWAGRLIQVQNLPRNYLGTLDEARWLVKKCDYLGVKAVYGNVPDTLSQLIRTAFIPSEGNHILVSDFSAIEARVIAWLAGESWVIDTFNNGGDIYCATASQMFGVPVEKHGVNGDLRQKGKVATLALGYQGGPGALIAMGALDMGMQEEELPEIVSKWREANPHIKAMWYAMENAAIDCVETCRTTHPELAVSDPARARENERMTGAPENSYSNWFKPPGSMIEMKIERDPIYGTSYFTIRLPSGRKLFYNSPVLLPNRFGSPSVHFMGLNQTTKKWEMQETYGGKIVENIVQAIARDCLAVTLHRVIKAGYQPVMHIHDEIVIDAKPGEKLEDVNKIFSRPIEWAPGLPLKGDGFISEYYKKD